jgi:hypothetical protein
MEQNHVAAALLHSDLKSSAFMNMMGCPLREPRPGYCVGLSDTE